MHFVRRPRHLASLPVLVAAAALLLGSAPALATDPSADEIIRRMKAALEPPKPSVRTMTLTFDDRGTKHTFGLVQARKKLADRERSLTVLLEPDDARGIAYLTAESANGQPVEWLYMPYVQRARKLVPAENYQSFLETDFTYGDLGLLPTDTKNTLLGTEQIGGRKTYRIESIPSSTVKQWYYSRSVTWIDAESLLPVRRELYSPANEVFKQQTFATATLIDGIPTVLETTITTVAANTSSTLAVGSVTYDTDIPDTLFEPEGLRKVADSDYWKSKQPRPAPGS